MPQTGNKRFDLAAYMKARKEARDKQVFKTRNLAKELKRIERLEKKIDSASERRRELSKEADDTYTNVLNETTSEVRSRKPTSLHNGTINVKERTAAKRREETLSACARVHGATKSNLQPAFDGMFDTLQKRCKLETLKNYVVSNKSLTKAVVSDSCKKDLEGFINSPDNIKRSISTFYSAGVLGKRKYQSVRQALSMKNHPSKLGAKTRITLSSGFKIPKLLTYNNLMAEVKRIDIGKVYEIDENYVAGIDSDENVNGAYRDLREYLPRLAKFYLQQNRKETLKWFGKTEGTFLVAFGGDGCPFGKHESACSFLISFLNVGRKVMSSNDNFIVFGANCQETSPVVKKFATTEEQLSQLAQTAIEYFRVNALFVETSVNPTVWTLGHVVPVHARQVFEQYGQGLGTVTMEGREAKHIFLKRLSENTTYQRRWVEILKHEFIMMVWLPEQGFKVSENKVQNAAYIPPRVFSDPAYCYCGLLKACSTAAKCTFCIDPVMRLIEKSITDGKITAELK